MRPENISELAAYPNVREFVRGHLAMQFGDVRAMLRLPLQREEIENGCNFAAASWLCNLISGISVVLFDRKGRHPSTRRRDRGERFCNLLSAAYYPWQSGEDLGQKSTALYQIVRNPFSHCLAILQPGDVPFYCRKTVEGMCQEEINALDVAYDGGGTLPPALEMVNGAWNLQVPFFYAAVLEMLRRLVCDVQQMQQAEACFARGELMD